MDEMFLDIAFLALLCVGIIIQTVLPIVLIVLGIIQTRKNKKSGIVLLIVGSAYLLLSMSYYIYPAYMYGA